MIHCFYTKRLKEYSSLIVIQRHDFQPIRLQHFILFIIGFSLDCIMKLLCILVFSIICTSMTFTDRDQSNQLFEYVFTEPDCENGIIEVTEFRFNTSFGPLHVGNAMICLDRSGYQSNPSFEEYAFTSNQTIHNFLSQIAQTQELAMEMWLQTQSQGITTKELFSFHTPKTSSSDFANVFTIYQSGNNLLLVIAQDLSSQQQLSVVLCEQVGLVHLVVNMLLSSSSTSIVV